MEAISPAELQPILDDIAHDMASATDRGEPAIYIPELGSVDPGQFGIALCLPGGETLQAGDATTPFSIQSISKVFTLAIALGRLGDSLWARVGREPSGLAFNSIVALEHNNGIPRNPFVNPGAIAVTDAILHGLQPRDVLAELLQFLRTAAEDDDIHIDKDVALSELAHAHRNIAMAEFMASHGNLQNPTALTIGTYCHQCAVDMTCVQLARAGRFLAGFANAPRLVSPSRVRRINALMLTCGHYDASGDFAYQVGLPGKSGVGGGILSIAPTRASIAVWSPGLNAQGNSKLGALAMERLAEATGWSVFG
ncbi:glutaminase [Pseudotabrizicola sediminis]|uniref:Glutaminase n=1 Tax=Pseudotabrizicola sediminis TaxID=2486418 RepID=A0ABY2KM25_9RHOB|nr:glutaminase [Pseudotabrizicola sediminis]TGD43598.1 glutaminase [Pseudotabrizicola sediminis]